MFDPLRQGVVVGVPFSWTIFWILRELVVVVVVWWQQRLLGRRRRWFCLIHQELKDKIET
jgi:hypothetical protein